MNVIGSNFRGNGPATSREIADHKDIKGYQLPQEYIAFLKIHNGGEGFIGDSYVIFWNISEIASMNEAYQVDDYAPGLVLFGSDGGGEAFAFDCREPGAPIVSLPFVGMDRKQLRKLAANFDDFLNVLAMKP